MRPVTAAADGRHSLPLHEPTSNRECCAIILRVATAVADFFRTIGLWLVETSLLLRDQVIGFFPEQLATQLIHIGIDEWGKTQVIEGKTYVIEAVADVPIRERAEVVRHTTNLVLQNMDGPSVAWIIKAVADVPIRERAEVVRHTTNLILQNMDGLSIARIIKAVADAPNDKRAEVVKRAASVITGDMLAGGRTGIIHAAAAVPAHKWDELISHTTSLITAKNCESEKVGIIEALAALPSQTWGKVVERITELFSQDLSEVGSIIRAFAAVPDHERADVVEHAAQLVMPNSGYSMAPIMKILATVPAQERGDLVKHTGQLIMLADNYLADREYWTTPIMRTLADEPAHERADIVQHALQLINPQMYANDILMITQNVALIPADQRAAYVRQRREGLPYAAQHARVAARHGVNVHEGERDRKTKVAIERLRQHQGVIPKDQLGKAVAGFTQYLDNRQMAAEDKRLAKYALSAPKKDDEDFGPLIGRPTFSLLGLMISGEEVIGRLWIFASKLKEPDQTNAKVSMIAALTGSYEEGFRVCDQGKTHRLIVGVLQGRLAGVDLELSQGMQVPTPQAVRMFFETPAHQRIEKLSELLATASQFCADNPLVKQEEFIREVRNYAKEQDMEDDTASSSSS